MADRKQYRLFFSQRQYRTIISNMAKTQANGTAMVKAVSSPQLMSAPSCQSQYQVMAVVKGTMHQPIMPVSRVNIRSALQRFTGYSPVPCETFPIRLEQEESFSSFLDSQTDACAELTQCIRFSDDIVPPPVMSFPQIEATAKKWP